MSARISICSEMVLFLWYPTMDFILSYAIFFSYFYTYIFILNLCLHFSDCLPSVKDARYVGNIDTTKEGKHCQRWDTNIPHPPNPKYTRDTFVDKRMDHNYCRNPTPPDAGGPWCYTTNRNTIWEYCDIPSCGMCLCTLFCCMEYGGRVRGLRQDKRT